MVIALLVTHSVDLQKGLGALLESLPGVKDVMVLRAMSSALGWIETHQPQIVFLDLSLSGKDTRPFLEKVRALSNGTKRVLLVDDLKDVNWVPQFAEAILLKGVAPSAVVAIVTNLLSVKGEENEHVF